MGVSGAGKTTVGHLLADKLGGLFVDGDDLHPQVNVDKMKQGIALTDADRYPWLDKLAEVIREHDDTKPLIVACSALKRSYRLRLGGEFHLVYLKGSSDEIARRLQDRHDHFMPMELLESQFAALEEPDNALVLDLGQSPHEIARKIIFELS
tara:strand:+ start:40 stop:495 length:456 start_codon:yes stop_codon:yes gene_type:complete